MRASLTAGTSGCSLTISWKLVRVCKCRLVSFTRSEAAIGVHRFGQRGGRPEDSTPCSAPGRHERRQTRSELCIVPFGMLWHG